MKFKVLLLGLLFGLTSLTAMAGSGHDHGHGHGHSQASINQDVAVLKATKIVNNLVERNTIEKSWKTIKLNSIEKKVFKGKSEWVASFVNKKVTDVKKQKLYVFLTLGGDYIAANYTGK